MNSAELEVKVKYKADEASLRQANQKIESSSKSANSATQGTAESMAQVKSSLEAIKRLDALTLLSNSFTKIKDQVEKTKESFKLYKEQIKATIKLFEYLKYPVDSPQIQYMAERMKIEPPITKARVALEILKKQLSNTKDLFKQVGKTAVSALTSVYGILLLIMGVIASIVALVKTVNEMTKIGAEIDDMAQKLQISNEKYQEWNYIMMMCGSSMNDLQTAMNGMVQRLKSVDQGSAEAIAGFQKLGISIYDATGNLRDNFELFEEAIEKLQQMEAGTERLVIAQQIFGRSASNLTILLNTSAKQMENIRRTQEVLGLSMSENAVRMSAVYQDAIDTMKQAGQSLKSVVMELFVQPFLNIVKAIIKAITYIKVFIQALFGLKGSNAVNDSVSEIGGTAENTEKKVNKLKRSLMGFDELNVVPSGETDSADMGADFGDMGLSNLKEDFDALFSEEELAKIEAFKQKIITFVDAFKNNPIVKGIITIGKKIFDGLKEIWDGIKENLGDTITEIWNLIVQVWNYIQPLISFAIDWAVGLLVPAINISLQLIKSVIGIVSAVIDTIIGIVSGIWTMLEGFFTFLWGWLTGDMEMMIDGVETSLDGFLQFWGSLWDGVKRILSNVWDFIKSVIIGITDGISSVVNAIRDFFGIDSNKKTGYTFTGGYTYQAMATGGIVNSATPALVGEAGREAVLPLENNTGWMDILADRIISKQNTPSKIVLQVGENELGWATINGINKITEQTGQVQLVV